MNPMNDPHHHHYQNYSLFDISQMPPFQYPTAAHPTSSMFYASESAAMSLVQEQPQQQQYHHQHPHENYEQQEFLGTYQHQDLNQHQNHDHQDQNQKSANNGGVLQELYETNDARASLKTAELRQTPPVATSSSSVFDTPETEEKERKNRKKAQPQAEHGLRIDDEEAVFLEVEGRIPIVNKNTVYGVSMREIRRRVAAPEAMNATTLGTFFKISKTASHTRWMRRLIHDNNIEFGPLRAVRRSKHALAGLSEREGQHLVGDIGTLFREYYPVDKVARKVVEQMVFRGHQLPQIHEHLQSSIKFVCQLIETMATIQPALTGCDEDLKGSRLDEPYRIYSMVTHGCGHALSLVHYRLHLNVYQKASELCARLICGQEPSIEPFVQMAPGERPFRVMTDAFFTNYPWPQRHSNQGNNTDNNIINAGTNSAQQH